MGNTNEAMLSDEREVIYNSGSDSEDESRDESSSRWIGQYRAILSEEENGDIKSKLLTLSKDNTCSLTTHSEIPFAFVSDPPSVKKGYWFNIGGKDMPRSGEIVLCKIRLDEPAYKTLGMSNIESQLQDNDDLISTWLTCSFEYWVPLSMIQRLEEDGESTNNDENENKNKSKKISEYKFEKDGSDCISGESVMIHDYDMFNKIIDDYSISLFDNTNEGIWNGGSEINSDDDLSTKTSIRSRVLRKLLTPSDSMGPSDGCYGKVGTLVEISCPKAIGIILSDALDTSLPSVGKAKTVNIVGVPSPWSCFTPMIDCQSCECVQYSNNHDIRLGGCHTSACEHERRKRQEEGGDGVLAYFESEFASAWETRVPPRRSRLKLYAPN